MEKNAVPNPARFVRGIVQVWTATLTFWTWPPSPAKTDLKDYKNYAINSNLQTRTGFFYPTKRDFTYIPAILQNTNRSRLDFFCISKTLINKVGNSQSTALFPAQSLTTKVSFLMSEKKQTSKKTCKFAITI